MKKMAILLILFLFPFASNSLAEEIQGKSKLSTFNTAERFDSNKRFNEQELIIKFKTGMTEDERLSLLSSAHLKEQSFYKGLSLVKVSPQQTLKKVADQLLKKDTIEFVEPNYQVKSAYIPKDSAYKKQWYLNKVNSEKAWDTTSGSPKITVAVIDGGMQTDHPEFKGRIVSPYNAVTDSKTITADSHGTHVAGIIAAANDNKGTVGIAPKVQIMPIDIFTKDGADSYDESVGIMYAVDHGANIINMSYNSLDYTYVEEYAIDYATEKGVVLVAAAGNEGNTSANYPAAYNSVISVTATDEKDRLTSYSNYGASVDISAPGDAIYSTVPTNSYQSMSGTSMAAPVVSGVAALILSKNPLLTPEEVKQLLVSTSKDLGVKGWDERFGYGRIDAEKALLNTPVPLSKITVSSPSFKINGQNKTKMSISVYKGSNVALTIENTNKKTIKKISSFKKWKGGNLEGTWDGTDDQNQMVPAGKYKVVVKAKNNKEIVTTSKTITVTHENTPKITMQGSSTVHFSPTRKQKGTVSFQLTKKAKIDAKIINSQGKESKILLSKKLFTAGNYSLSWDGTDKGKRVVKDGTYQLVLSLSDSKSKAAYAKMVVDTKAASVKEKNSSSILQMNGKKQISSTLELSEDSTVTAFIRTDNGNKIKRLVHNKKVKAGKTAFNWNGKNDKKAFVQEGNYYYYYEIKDKAGNTTSKNSTAFYVQDWQKPSLTVDDVNYDKTAVEHSIPFTTSKHGIVRMEIRKEKTTVKTLEKETEAGNQSLSWDGKDNNGNILEDGSYEIMVTLIDPYQQSISKTAKLIPSFQLEAPDEVQYNSNYEAEQAAEVYYHISQNAKVTIIIYDTYGNLIKNIQKQAPVKSGINHFQWNGKDEEGYWGMDDQFSYEIIAETDGNKQSFKGKMTTEKPAWLQQEQLSKVPSNEEKSYTKGINLAITTTGNMSLVWNVYNQENNLINSQTFQLIQGLFTYYYEKPSLTENYHYVLNYTDHLGNKFTQEYDEYAFN
ncbi:MAG: S8 family serine peptidase [Bacillus sp. (in: firmicutes)]